MKRLYRPWCVSIGRIIQQSLGHLNAFFTFIHTPLFVVLRPFLPKNSEKGRRKACENALKRHGKAPFFRIFRPTMKRKQLTINKEKIF